MGGGKSKPRDLGNDRGYRVVVGGVWVEFHLNPHPLKTEGAAPKIRSGGRRDSSRLNLNYELSYAGQASATPRTVRSRNPRGTKKGEPTLRMLEVVVPSAGMK